MIQMAMLLLKENNCAKIFRNLCINVDVMDKFNLDLFIIRPSSVTLTLMYINMFQMALLHFKENNRAKLFRHPCINV